MYYRVSIICAFLLLLPGRATLFSQNLHVYKNSGTHNVYELGNLRKLTFGTDRMYVFRKGYSPSGYLFQDIRCVTFSDLNTAAFDTKAIKPGDVFWYPNPVNEEMNIRFWSADYRMVQIAVYAIDGKLLFKESFHAQRGENFKKVYLSDLINGIYICRMNTGSDIKTFKILKH